jgi:hypothetical protein
MGVAKRRCAVGVAGRPIEPLSSLFVLRSFVSPCDTVTSVPFVSPRLAACVLVAVACSGMAAAQERPAPVIEFQIGSLAFPDDGVVREGLAGGAARWYVSPRLAFGPEVGYVSGSNHSHVILTGNLTFDVLSPLAGRPRAVSPFVVAGGGLFQTRERFPSGPFTSADGAFTAGGGVRGSVGHRVTVGIDARIGWELHLRVNALVGVSLGR